MVKAKRKSSVLKKAILAKSKKRRVVKRAVKKVPAVQKGYHSLTPCLTIQAAAKAIQFYKEIFGAKEVMRMERPGGKISHAELKIGDAKFMLADECIEMNVYAPLATHNSGFSIHLYIKDVDTVVKRAVSAGAKLIRPVQDMFYGDRSGFIEDPFGHKWHISTHIENVSPAQVKKRAAALFSNK